jgi:hypothetical protein
VSAPQSLADQAVETLAMVRALGDDLNMSHPQRHAVRNLKRIAEAHISNALRTAADIAYQARDLASLVADVRAEATPPQAQGLPSQGEA